MKVRSSVKPICEKCKIIKRKGSKTQTETGLIRQLNLTVWKRELQN